MKAKYIALLLIIGCIAAYFFNAFKLDWQFARLESNAQKVITPAQFQTWATNLITTLPTNTTNIRVEDLGTNFPTQLLPLYHRPPFVLVQQAYRDGAPSVYLRWGGGVIGQCGFEVGPPEFVSYRPNARAWAPGVYFWSDRQ